MTISKTHTHTGICSFKNSVVSLCIFKSSIPKKQLLSEMIRTAAIPYSMKNQDCPAWTVLNTLLSDTIVILLNIQHSLQFPENVRVIKIPLKLLRINAMRKYCNGKSRVAVRSKGYTGFIV